MKFFLLSLTVACFSFKALGDFHLISSVALVSASGPIYLEEEGQQMLAPPQGTFVQIFARPINSKGNFEAVRSRFSQEVVFELVQPGFFDGGISDALPGIEPEEDGEFFVRAWRGAATWEEATMNPEAFIGRTPVFRNETGFINTLAKDFVPSELDNMPSLTLEPVPEPSTIGLGLVGLLLLSWSIPCKKTKCSTPRNIR